MGLFYLANCLALATGPHVLVYRSSGMKENDAFWKCFRYGILYGLAQMLKFFLATLFPHDVDASPKNVLYLDALSIMIDLVFVYSIVSRASSRSEFNLLVACLGWSTAALISTRYVPIWFGTKGVEFDVMYLCLSYEANLDMIMTCVLFYSLWLLVRKHGSFGINLVTLVVLCCAAMRQVIFNSIDRFVQPIFKALVLKTVLTLSLGVTILLLKKIMKTERISAESRTAVIWRNVLEPFNLTWKQYIAPALGLKPNRDGRPLSTRRHN